MVDIRDFIYYVAFEIAGIYLIRRGWLTLKYKNASLFLTHRIVLWLLRVFKGDEVAQKKENEIRKSMNLKFYGWNALVTGVLAIIVGILGFILVLIKLLA